jgi:hypothetical protein
MRGLVAGLCGVALSLACDASGAGATIGSGAASGSTAATLGSNGTTVPA